MRRHGFTLNKLHASRSGYQIEGTDLFVERFEAKKYGAPAEWDITIRDRADWPLVTGKSLDDALYRLATIRDRLTRNCPKGLVCTFYDSSNDDEED